MKGNVVIVGGGRMGSGISAVSALHGNSTILTDINRDAAERGIERAWACIQELAENGLADENQVEKAKMLLKVKSNLKDALSQASMVIEAVPENLELKKSIFAQIEKITGRDVPILSNTSGLRITDISGDMEHPERAVTAHFWYPAHLVPLVEVVMGDKTREETACFVKDEIASWGKKTVLVKKDLPGQLANRILQAVIREAVNIVQMGLASPEDVDTAVKAGMGIRFPVWGPLEHIDAVGLDLCSDVQDTVLPGLSARTDANPLMRKLAGEGNLGYKTGRGIYDWSKKDMEALEKKRNDFIIQALGILK